MVAKISPHTTTERMKTDTILMILGVVALVLVAIYLIDPGMLGMGGRSGSEGFATMLGSAAPAHGSTGDMPTGTMEYNGKKQANANMTKEVAGFQNEEEEESGFAEEGEEDGFENGPANFGAAGAPAGCYPRDQLQASELLPKDANSVWAQQNPMGPGSLKGVNFLSAGALVGINTVGQSLKNANLQLRSEPPNPQVAISVFNNSTIEPDFNRRPLEIN